MGGCNFRKKVSNQNLQLQKSTGFVFKMENMPSPKFAHGACICRSEIVVAGGTSVMDMDMGMRLFPTGDTSCYSFDIFTYKWR